MRTKHLLRVIRAHHHLSQQVLKKFVLVGCTVISYFAVIFLQSFTPDNLLALEHQDQCTEPAVSQFLDLSAGTLYVHLFVIHPCLLDTSDVS